jgi:monothiol glutaredoxin
MTARPLHDPARVSPAALTAMSSFHAKIIGEVSAAVQNNPVVVIGMGWNPHVGAVRKILDEAGIQHTYLGYGNYLSGWKERLAIKLWSGWPTFPQVFVRGTLVGGKSDTKKALDDGSFKALLGG